MNDDDGRSTHAAFSPENEQTTAEDELRGDAASVGDVLDARVGRVFRGAGAGGASRLIHPILAAGNGRPPRAFGTRRHREVFLDAVLGRLRCWPARGHAGHGVPGGPRADREGGGGAARVPAAVDRERRVPLARGRGRGLERRRARDRHLRAARGFRHADHARVRAAHAPGAGGGRAGPEGVHAQDPEGGGEVPGEGPEAPGEAGRPRRKRVRGFAAPAPERDRGVGGVTGDGARRGAGRRRRAARLGRDARGVHVPR